ncbi:MAG: rhodanese-like domain-containing protein [Bacilli bacterium]|nr:rhodanese-like domain-containing protein [Bacilli bacterium]
MNNIKEITTHDLFKFYQKYNNFRIIDVRDPNEYDQYHIHGSINIPCNLLIEKHNLFIKKNFSYFIICQNGSRSKTASIALSKLNYNVTNVINGIDKWPGLLISSKRYKF